MSSGAGTHCWGGEQPQGRAGCWHRTARGGAAQGQQQRPPPACSGCWSQAPASRWVVLGLGALGVVIPHLWGKVGGSRRCGGSERGLLSWDVFSPWAVSLSPERGSPHLRWLTAIPGSRGSTWLGSRAGIIKPQAMLGRKKLLQVLGTQQNSPGEQWPCVCGAGLLYSERSWVASCPRELCQLRLH